MQENEKLDSKVAIVYFTWMHRRQHRFSKPCFFHLAINLASAILFSRQYSYSSEKSKTAIISQTKKCIAKRFQNNGTNGYLCWWPVACSRDRRCNASADDECERLARVLPPCVCPHEDQSRLKIIIGTEKQQSQFTIATRQTHLRAFWLRIRPALVQSVPNHPVVCLAIVLA